MHGHFQLFAAICQGIMSVINGVGYKIYVKELWENFEIVEWIVKYQKDEFELESKSGTISQWVFETDKLE